MGSDFSGETATYYARYRRGYPPAAIDAIAEAFGLGVDDLVVDLGCGTGQLSLPLAARVRAVVGVDPEPDMLMLARRTAQEHVVANASWLLGADTDVPTLGHLLGDRTVGAVTIALAIHWMDRDTLFRAIRPLLRPGGGIAVVTNGTPLWLQDTEWSRILRQCLEQWTGKRQTGACQTDDAGRQLNQEALTSAGYRVVESSVDYQAEVTVEQIVGGIFSAMSADRLCSRASREEFAAQVRDALAGHEPLDEQIRVSLQFGHIA
ncbi:MAG TPA: class I SAM-dependent methyltransferase [Candidatus Limnocylindrales bacterium]